MNEPAATDNDAPSTALVRRPLDAITEIVKHLDDITKIANALCKASALPGPMRDPANMTLVLLQGLEMGFTPVQAIRASYVIQSKAGVKIGYYSDSLVALVRKSRVCRFFRVVESTAEKCVIECARTDEADDKVYKFEMTRAQASASKVDQEYDRDTKSWSPKYPWTTAPADMLRNRTQGKAVKAVFQDVVFGMATPDDLDDIEPREVGPGIGNAPQSSAKFEAISFATKAAPASSAAIVDADIVEDPPVDAAAEVDAPAPDAPVTPAPAAPTIDDVFVRACEAFRKAAGGQTPIEPTTEGALVYFDGLLSEVESERDLRGLLAKIKVFESQSKRSPACAEVATHMMVAYNHRAAEMPKAK